MESAAAATMAAEPLALPALLGIRRVDGAPFAAALRQRFRVLDFFASGSPPLPAFLAAAAVVMGGGPARVDAEFLDALPSLRCVVSTAAGLDHIDVHECARRGVAVANSGRVYSADVADHAVCMLIDVPRRVTASERFVRRGLWALQGDLCLGSKVLLLLRLRSFSFL